MVAEDYDCTCNTLYTGVTAAAERQASAGARDGVKGNRRTLAARAPLHAPVGRRAWTKAQLRHDEHRGTEQPGDMRAWREKSRIWHCPQ